MLSRSPLQFRVAQQGPLQHFGRDFAKMERSSFGAVARARRKSLDIKLREVAAAIGRAPSHVSNIECGRIEGSPTDRSRIEAYLRERERFPLPFSATPRRGTVAP